MEEIERIKKLLEDDETLYLRGIVLNDDECFDEKAFMNFRSKDIFDEFSLIISLPALNAGRIDAYDVFRMWGDDLDMIKEAEFKKDCQSIFVIYDGIHCVREYCDGVQGGYNFFVLFRGDFKGVNYNRGGLIVLPTEIVETFDLRKKRR